MKNSSGSTTRRVLAWGLVGIGAGTIAFITIWGAVKGIDSFVTLGVGFFSAVISGIAVFYFSRED